MEQEFVDEEREVSIRSKNYQPPGTITWLIDAAIRNKELNIIFELGNKGLDVKMGRVHNDRFRLETERMKVEMIRDAQDRADEIIRERKK